MNHRLTATALLCACVACMPAGPGATRTTDPAPRAQSVTESVDEFVALLNEARREACGADLTWDEDVAQVALGHSRDMHARGYFSHVSPEGADMGDRLQNAGVAYRAVAENIASGARSGREVFTGWRNSPGHRRNMMNCEYTRHGVGRFGNLWTHVLMR